MTNLNTSFNVFITKNNEKSSIIIETYGELLNNLKLKVSYTFKNNEPKYLYSVDYNDGIVYFSKKKGFMEIIFSPHLDSEP